MRALRGRQSRRQTLAQAVAAVAAAAVRVQSSSRHLDVGILHLLLCLTVGHSAGVPPKRKLACKFCFKSWAPGGVCRGGAMQGTHCAIPSVSEAPTAREANLFLPNC